MQQTVLILFLIIGLGINTVIGQRKTKEEDLKNITGMAIGSEEMSLEQVKQKAIGNAKIEALKAAGIEENINSYSDYFKSESDNKLEELFASDILSDIRGTVKNVEVVNTNKGFTNEGYLKVTVTINCTVVKYNSERDLTFDAWVDGIKMFYKENDGLEFKVKSTQNCYIRAFMFGPKEAYVLLPNDYEKSFILKAHEEYKFPYNVDQYTLYTTGPKKETNRLVLVFTKKEVFYTGEVDYKGITDWIMSIPPDERSIKSYGFDIVKQ
jgi:hypothetical protein